MAYAKEKDAAKIEREASPRRQSAESAIGFGGLFQLEIVKRFQSNFGTLEAKPRGKG